jgi:hypothetical protein
MTQWDWLERDESRYTGRWIVRVLLKAALLFVLLNIVFALVDPLPALGRLSVYGWLAPARERLPYGENVALSNNLSLNSLDAMFASHAVALPKAADEYRVLVLGDSATWGFLLQPQDTLAGWLNRLDLRTGDGQRVRAYNLGYPEMSLMKDVLLLDYAARYHADLIVWAVTLESFAPSRQASPALIRNNPAAVQRLTREYDITLENPNFVERSLLDNTIVGRRRELADWLRLQLLGFAWGATGIDQYYPETFTLRSSDFELDPSWGPFADETDFTIGDIAFDVLTAGMARVGDVPVLLVNEPMFISSGTNSDIRYNFFYPRWAYDRYRDLLMDTAAVQGWTLLDTWDSVAPDEFTDSPVHMTPEGTRQLAEQVAAALDLSAAVTQP